MSRATIKDIARVLSISPSTVSRALRDHPDISKETKEKVLNIAKELDYFPDSLAQGLKSRRTNTIGIIVPEIKHHFFSSAISGIEDVTYNSGFTILVWQSNESVEREKVNLKALVSNRIAGLLVSISQTTTDLSHFDILKKRGIPVVFFDRTIENIQESKVIVDDFKGAYDAATHLIDRGYKRIAHIAGPENISISKNRFLGYKAALADNNIPFNDELVIDGGFRQIDGSNAAQQLLSMENRPDAIFAINDPVAIGAFSKIKEMKISIPDEIALVGFSNNPVSSLIDPALTTVEQPSHEIGKVAAELLLEKINHDSKKDVVVEKILKTKLIIRQSS
jgi:DNA-binding LacI/PurR family transcriptional regulator